jgi:ABC transporter substrate binding protein (PQQ-dependent alcohol dehydrogenase system)
VVAGVLTPPPAAAEPEGAAEIRMAYLGQTVERPPALSNLEWLAPADDEGLQGARLGIDDNATTGRFTNQTFVLDEKVVAADGDIRAAVRDLHADGHRFLVANVAGEALDAIVAMPEAQTMLIFNAGAPDDRFRVAECAAFLLHTLPSRAMLADALAQYLVKQNWTEWFLVTGTRPQDALFAKAVRRAAKRFGADIVAEKTWTFDHDIRRMAQAEMPRFTQVDDHDVLIVADELGLFGDYLMYGTWLPRPVAGTQGLVPAAWDRTVEQWGATQLQNRFTARAGRGMSARDYAAWAAVRSIGEAATRTGSNDFEAMKSFITGDGFELAGFKGRKLSYRLWNGQLRQPIPLTTPRAIVTLSPQEGFLHQHTELDTLGYDAPETTCAMN